MTVHNHSQWRGVAAPLDVRDATLADAEQLGALHVLCWRETYAGLVDPQILAGMMVGDRAASWARQIETLPETNRILVIEAGGELIGFGAAGAQRNASLGAQGYDGEIGALYLRKEWQNRGLGRRLFHGLVSALRQRGFRRIALWVLAENERAVRFYQHLGGRSLTYSQAVPVSGGPRELAIGWWDLPAFGSAPSRTSQV